MMKGGFRVWLLGSAVFLLMQAPVANLGIGYLDEGYLLVNAGKILGGLVPYRDFFATITPGTFYIQAGLMKVFGGSLMVARWEYVVWVVAGMALGLMAFEMSGWRKWLWVGMIAVVSVAPGAYAFYNLQAAGLILAAQVLLRREKWWWAGVFVGSAILVKQSLGGAALVGMGWYLKDDWRRLVRFGWGVGSVLGLALGYFWGQGALGQMGYYTLQFAAQVKGHQADFVRHRVAALGVLAAGWGAWRRRPEWRKWLLVLAALGAVGYAAAKPGRWGRLVTYVPDPVFWLYTVMFAGPIWTVWHTTDKQERLEGVVMLVGFMGAAASGYTKDTGQILAPWLGAWMLRRFDNRLAAIAVTTIMVWWLAPGREVVQRVRQMERARPQTEEVVGWINELSKSDDKVLCFPHCPMINVLAGREVPGYFSAFYFELFRQEDQGREVEDLEREKPKLVVLQKSGRIDGFADEEFRRLPRLAEYFRDKYGLERENAEFEVRVRK